jgi:hypothetical protein
LRERGDEEGKRGKGREKEKKEREQEREWVSVAECLRCRINIALWP